MRPDPSAPRVIAAAERFRSRQDGIESWHCFSAGAHYDPANTSFDLLVGVDEHVIEPRASAARAGFDWHAHRGVDIVTWVQSGVLHHQDGDGDERDVAADEVLLQRAASGIRHRETNAGDVPLRFVQMTLLVPDDPAAADEATGVRSVHDGRLPLVLGAAAFDVWVADRGVDARAWHAFVAHGNWRLENSNGDGTDDRAADVAAGDSVRGHGRVTARGTGRLLMWSFR